jgi:hypothetical protein
MCLCTTLHFFPLTNLRMRINDQLMKFKDDIQEKELFEIITAYYPTMDQVRTYI